MNIATVVNLQRKMRIDVASFREFATHLSPPIAEADTKTFSVAIVSDRRMEQLNSFFRGKKTTTDVLSFPHEPDEFVQSADFSPSDTDKETADSYLGDIVISVEQAQKQAEENGLTLENEIKQLILHGLLHLCSYDHETDDGEMNARELELRRTLKI